MNMLKLAIAGEIVALSLLLAVPSRADEKPSIDDALRAVEQSDASLAPKHPTHLTGCKSNYSRKLKDDLIIESYGTICDVGAERLTVRITVKSEAEDAAESNKAAKCLRTGATFGACKLTAEGMYFADGSTLEVTIAAKVTEKRTKGRGSRR